MTQVQVAYADGNWCCYSTDDARKRRFVGCRHFLPRSAVAHANALSASREPLDPSSVPLYEAVLVGGSRESVRADSPDSRGPG